MELLLFADILVKVAATSAVSLLVLPTSVITLCFFPGLTTPGKAIKVLLCPSPPSQISNEQVV